MNPVIENALQDALQGHTGRKFLPGSAGWDEARSAWNLAVDQHPAAVLFPETVSDVAAAIAFARRLGLRLAVQGTGHGAAALGTVGDSVLVRTSAMRKVEIDVARRRARVEAGALWEDVMVPATSLGVTALHGSSPDVGVVGYSLGGGIGWMARRFGMAANSVTAIELVTADGEHVRADADREPDLFWAMRGGGGGFGVVTALEFALYPVEHAYAGWLVWPWERSRDVLLRFAEWTETAPDTITSLVRILRLPDAPFVPEPFRGRDLVTFQAAYLGDEARGTDLIRPLRELGPELDTFASVPAIELTRLHQDPEGPTPAVADGGLFDELTPAAIDAFLAVSGPGSRSPLISNEIRHLGGALATPAPGAGALSHLDAGFVQLAVGPAPDPAIAAAGMKRAHLVKETLGRHGRGKLYPNFAGSAVDAAAMYDAETFARLREIRTRVDPDGLFRAKTHIPVD
jgi:FAD/FMN-containing dehydrogenase